MESNPYHSPKDSSARARPERSRFFGLGALGCGGLSLTLAVVALLAGNNLFHDDFGLFFMMFLAASLFVWPFSIAAIVYAAIAVFRERQVIMPIVGIVFGCLGVGLIVWAWSS